MYSAATRQPAQLTAHVWPRKMLSSCCCCNPNSEPWEVSEELRGVRVQRFSLATRLERLCRNLCRPYGTPVSLPTLPSNSAGLFMNPRCHPERSARLTRFFCGSGGRAVEGRLLPQKITVWPSCTAASPGRLAPKGV